MTPSALLFEASIHFEQKSEKAYENIREIKKGAGASQALASAVAACTEAAGYEFSEQFCRYIYIYIYMFHLFISLFEYLCLSVFVSIMRYVKKGEKALVSAVCGLYGSCWI